MSSSIVSSPPRLSGDWPVMLQKRFWSHVSEAFALNTPAASSPESGSIAGLRARAGAADAGARPSPPSAAPNDAPNELNSSDWAAPFAAAPSRANAATAGMVPEGSHRRSSAERGDMGGGHRWAPPGATRAPARRRRARPSHRGARAGRAMRARAAGPGTRFSAHQTGPLMARCRARCAAWLRWRPPLPARGTRPPGSWTAHRLLRRCPARP
jgi:hypothetical protein